MRGPIEISKQIGSTEAHLCCLKVAKYDNYLVDLVGRDWSASNVHVKDPNSWMLLCLMINLYWLACIQRKGRILDLHPRIHPFCR